MHKSEVLQQKIIGINPKYKEKETQEQGCMWPGLLFTASLVYNAVMFQKIKAGRGKNAGKGEGW